MNKVFLTLSFLMGLVVLASNYLVQFPIKYYGLEEILTYGAFSYPISFLITDLANRAYGKIVARKIVLGNCRQEQPAPKSTINSPSVSDLIFRSNFRLSKPFLRV